MCGPAITDAPSYRAAKAPLGREVQREVLIPRCRIARPGATPSDMASAADKLIGRPGCVRQVASSGQSREQCRHPFNDSDAQPRPKLTGNDTTEGFILSSWTLSTASTRSGSTDLRANVSLLMPRTLAAS